VAADVDKLLISGDEVSARLDARAAEVVLAGRGDSLAVGGRADLVVLEGRRQR
jgi:hypothetical protein